MVASYPTVNFTDFFYSVHFFLKAESFMQLWHVHVFFLKAERFMQLWQADIKGTIKFCSRCWNR